MSELIEGLGSETVAVAARTQVNSDLSPLAVPFVRLRSRNLLHRGLPRAIRPYSPLSGANILYRTIRKTSTDRVLCHFGTEAIEYEQVWQESDVPLFVHFHGYDTTFDMLSQDGSGTRVHSSDYKSKIVALSSRATFIANSNHTMRKLVDGGVPPDRVKLNYLGVPVPEEIPRKSGNAVPVVLFLGRLVDFKAPALAIEAFTRAREMGAPGKLIIAGNGPEMANVEASHDRSAFKEDIQILGPADSVVAGELVQRADIFIIHNCVGAVTGQEEALNLAVLEAMAAGTPICGTATGGVNETNVNGKTGILTEPLDVSAQGEALYKLLMDEQLRQVMGLNAWRRVSEQFNQRTQIQSLGNILRSDGS